MNNLKCQLSYFLSLSLIIFSLVCANAQIDCRCFEGSDRNLSGNVFFDQDFGASNSVVSTQYISNNNDVRIAAGSSVCLLPPFQVSTGSDLEAFIQDCSTTQQTPTKVLIIGAGAAGLTAAYLLKQQGIDYQILEAASIYGGRMKSTNTFADFPIALGAEWLHVSTSIFEEIVNFGSTQVNVNTLGYHPSDMYGSVSNGIMTTSTIGPDTGIDRKFINTTWLGFYDQYIVPAVINDITYNTFVNAINYSSNSVSVQTTSGVTYEADKVIITVPLRILQNNISFTPILPLSNSTSIQNSTMWDGMKVFIEFTDEFYPTFLLYDITTFTSGQKLYYDAAYGQNSNKNILGFIAVGNPALNYTSLSENQIISDLLNELDLLFNNQASANYVKHVVQNWTAEPFVLGAYLQDYETANNPLQMAQSVSNKLFFAGEAYSSQNWGSVDVAARSAKRAVEEIVLGLK